jgi:hypothetical protein
LSEFPLHQKSAFSISNFHSNQRRKFSIANSNHFNSTEEFDIGQKLGIDEQMRLGYKRREQRINQQNMFNEFYGFLHDKNERCVLSISFRQKKYIAKISKKEKKRSRNVSPELSLSKKRNKKPIKLKLKPIKESTSDYVTINNDIREEKKIKSKNSRSSNISSRLFILIQMGARTKKRKKKYREISSTASLKV